ncbi:hypothetical protein GF374_02420 [Candidatus Woesearchaeota archaeon]|nr:hypothetical protein [Candidatus Woesearchaeota archaeon]
MVFDAAINLLGEFGFFRVVLPFLLIFALFYAVLLKTGILGQAEQARVRTIASIIAFVAAFLVIAYTPVVDALATLIPQASFLLVIAMLFLMLLAFIVPKWEDKIGKSKLYWGAAAVILFVIFLAMVGVSVGDQVPILGTFAKLMMGQIPLELTTETINLLIAFAVIIGVPLFVMAMVAFSGRKKFTGIEMKPKS